MHRLLVFVELLAASVWIGGFVAIGVASSVARAQLDPPARVAFFRSLGQRYLRVGGGALALALLAGLALLADGPWEATKTLAVGIGVALPAVTAAGVRQARSIGRLRGAALHDDAAALAGIVERRSRSALVARASIGLLTLAELATAVLLVR